MEEKERKFIFKIDVIMADESDEYKYRRCKLMKG